MNEQKETKEYNPNRKRNIIKNILIVFLVILLVLTFFSNTIMNKSLAEVSIESAMSGKLTERIRGSGLIESNQSYEVKIDGNKTIDTIMVKTGQEVKKDDVLFTVGAEENPELESAETELIALELEYEKSLLGINADYSTENQAIANARDDLNSAIAKRDNAIANENSESQALYNYTSNKNELSRNNELLNKIQNTVSAIDADDLSSAGVEYIGSLVSLYNRYQSAENDYNSAYNLYSQMLTNTVPEMTAMGEANPEEETAPNNSADSIEILKADLEAKESARNNARNEYEAEKSNVRNNLINQMYGIQDNIATLESYIAEYEASQNGGSGMSVEDCDAEVQAKQHALEELIASLNKTKSENELLSKTNILETEAKKKEIDNLKKKIEKIKQESSVIEIKSKYSGIVSSINVKTGEETVPDMPLAVIDISEEGYTVEISVDGEKAKKIKKGIEAEVVNNWNGDITAVLTDIKNDTKAGSKNRILTFSVTGDVDTGSMLDLSIPCGNGSYDTIVPKSAVHKDNDGYFVLAVNSKSSPLGNRYFAEKISVEVIASDEISSAVQGGISSGSYIITTSSEPVNPNDQVRMKDK